jgi:uncharacterized protein
MPTTSTTLATWLHLTDSCNLRCASCYLPHHPLHMSAETGRAAIAATVRSALTHGYQQIKLKYAGGEPLLQVALLATLHTYARRLCHASNLALDGVVLTNGTLLTSRIIARLQALTLRLTISLDDTATAAPPQRPYASGHGSAADAMQAIELALAHGLVPDISITVSGRNAAHLPDLVAWVLERNLPFSLNFYREHDYAAVHHDLHMEETAIIAGLRAAYAVIEQRMPTRSLLATLADRANFALPHRYPCSVGQSYMVVDPQGNIARCQMALHEQVTTVAADDPLARIRTQPAHGQGIHNVAVDEKHICHSCEWKYWCAGGCPLAAYRATGRYDAPSPHCAIYKAIYPEVVRLEQQRWQRAAHEQEQGTDAR